MLNVASTGMFTTLTSTVNLKWYACKKWTSSLKLVAILAQCRYAKTAQRIFTYSDTQYTSLTLDKMLNSLVYRTLFYVNIYGSYKLLKTVRFFGPPCSLYVAKLKCQHWGYALVLTFQLRDIYICMSHSPSCVICSTCVVDWTADVTRRWLFWVRIIIAAKSAASSFAMHRRCSQVCFFCHFSCHFSHTLREIYCSRPAQAVSFVQFESMTACLSSRIPLKESIKFKYSETILSHCANVLIPKRANLGTWARLHMCNFSGHVSAWKNVSAPALYGRYLAWGKATR